MRLERNPHYCTFSQSCRRGILKGVWRKLKSLQQEFAGNLVYDYLARRALGVLGIGFQRYHLVIQPVAEGSRVPERHRAVFDIREVDEDSYRTEWFPRPAKVIRERFAQGARCWVAFKEGAPVGCQWLLNGPYLEDEVRCRFIPLPEGRVAWDFDVYVAPDFRMGRLFLLLWDTANQWMREQGITCSASRIDTLNLQSIRSHQRMGARIVGNAWFLTLGRIQLAGWPDGWRLSRAAVPDIPVMDVGCSGRTMKNDGPT